MWNLVYIKLLHFRRDIEQSMREITHESCEKGGLIKLNRTAPDHPASYGVAERAINVLANAVRAVPYNSCRPL